VFGDGFGTVALPFAVLASHGHVSEVAIALLTSTVVATVCVSAAGTLVDRRPEWPLARASFLIMGASQVVLVIFAVRAGDLTLGVLILAQAVYGLGHALSLPALTALTPRVVTPEELRRTNGFISVGQSLGMVAGPAAAGVLVAVSGPAPALAVNAGSFVLASLLTPRPGDRSRTRAHVSDTDSGVRRGLLAVADYPWLAVSLPAHLLWNAGAGLFYAVGPLKAAESEYGAMLWAAAASALAVGAVVGGMVSTRVSPRKPVSMANMVVTLMGLEVAAFVLSDSVVIISVAAFLGGFGLEFMNALWTTSMQKHVDDRVLGSVSALESAVMLGGMAGGYLCAGALTEYAGSDVALTGAAIAMILPCASVAFLRSVRLVGRLDDGPRIGSMSI